MKTLIVYDSAYGNTEKVARAIGDAVMGEVEVLRVGEVNSSELKIYDLLIFGSPTQGGKPTRVISDFLSQITAPIFQSVKSAAFDTRLSKKWVGIFGNAASGIANRLKANGLTLIVPPEGFFVKGTKGELENGEVEHAAVWAKEIIDKIK